MPGYKTPAQNHHYGTRKAESVKQERSNLLNDNPVARDASGGRPWIAKHFKSTMGSAMKMGHESPNEMGHSPNEMGHSPNEMKYGSGPEMGHESPAEKALVGNQKNLPKHLRDAIEAAPEMKYGGPDMKYGGPEMGHESPAEKHCMGGSHAKMKAPLMQKEEMKEAAKKAAEAAGRAGAKVVKKIYKKKNK